MPDEILRAEWAARVGALDLYVHELVAEKMLEIFTAARLPARSFHKVLIGSATLLRIRAAAVPSDAEAAFDLEIRERIGRQTFQFPDDIATAIRSISDVELWNDIAASFGAKASEKVDEAKVLRQTLSAIVERRNKIVHEGDLQSAIPRIPYPVSLADLVTVEQFIKNIVDAIDALV